MDIYTTCCKNKAIHTVSPSAQPVLLPFLQTNICGASRHQPVPSTTGHQTCETVALTAIWKFTDCYYSVFSLFYGDIRVSKVSGKNTFHSVLCGHCPYQCIWTKLVLGVSFLIRVRPLWVVFISTSILRTSLLRTWVFGFSTKPTTDTVLLCSIQSS